MLGGEGMVYDPIDLKSRLVRAYAPMDKCDELSTRLRGILGHEHFEVIPLEALDALPQAGVVGQTRVATYKGLSQLQTDFVKVQQMYAQAARTGSVVDAQFIIQEAMR